MGKFPDLGVLLQLVGAQITASYVEGSPLQAGRFDLRAQLDITSAPGSPMGGIVVKLQSSRAGQNDWCDVVSTRDDSGIEELEHTYSFTPGQPISYSISAKTRGLLNTRWLVRATGGAGEDGDEISISAVAL